MEETKCIVGGSGIPWTTPHRLHQWVVVCPGFLCTGVFPFQSRADNHINHQAMMRFQRADSHEPHWYSTFCMTVWHKRELLLSLLFCAPWFPHQNKEIIILVPAHFLWTLTDWKAIKCVKAIWKLSAAQQGGTTTVANCHILSKKKKNWP